MMDTGGKKIKIQAPKGTKDVLPDESYKWQALEAALRESAELFGYGEIRFPVFEHTELFLRGIGDTTDVVQKEMYTFEDKGGRSITLRPEGTASVVRALNERGLASQAMPLKCYYIAPNFRYEKPQAGRLRQHHQFGAECFGAEGPGADAELIALAWFFLKRLGLSDGVALNINSIGCPECRPVYHTALRDYFSGKKAEVCGTCLDRLERNPLRILDCKNPDCAAVAAGAPKGIDYLCSECDTHFSSLRAELDAMGIPYELDPMIVRGLDYYTRTVFEFVCDRLGAQKTVCGGGRYDGLVSELGGPPTPALGFGSGLERLLLAREALGLEFDRPEPCELYIAALGPGADGEAAALCLRLRERGLRVERDLCGRGLKAQMKYADKLGAKYVIVLGDDEIARREAYLKRMDTGEASPCGLDAGEIYEAINK